MMDPVETTLLANRLAQIPAEMGATLKASAFSPNITERMDASCALFDADARMIAQAEHIPVHLGALPLAVAQVADRDWRPGDQLLFNAPELAGTHLPDLTLVAPVFDGDLVGFVASKAHHADIGGQAPGSMPTDSTTLAEEGLVVPPVRLVEAGDLAEDVVELIAANTRTPDERVGDLQAQIGANDLGRRRLLALRDREPDLDARVEALLDHSEERMEAAIGRLPNGTWTGLDLMEERRGTPEIAAEVTIHAGRMRVDFEGTAPQRDGNLNAPLGVTHAGVHFVLRALTDPTIPRNAGSLRPLSIDVPEGSMLDPGPDAPVAGGNVETSQRIVDVLLNALREPLDLPAQSQGTMNNVLIGGEDWSYYETLAGGAGAGPDGPGTSAVHTYMTNTENTPIEVLETRTPLRVMAYEVIDRTGGDGRHRGGDGLRRAYQALEPATATLLTERREIPPSGAAGGREGRRGRNLLLRDGETFPLSAKTRVDLDAGDLLVVETPGGGGWGTPD